MFNEELVIGFEWKLLLVNRLFGLQVKMVLVGFASTQIRFGGADDLSVFVQQLEVARFELVRHVEVGSLRDLFIGQGCGQT